MSKIYESTRDRRYLDYITKWVDGYVNEQGVIGWDQGRTHNLDYIQPGILLLVLFSGLKLLETRTHRDAAVVAFLAYFLVITNFLYTQSMFTAALMVPALLATTATLVGLAAPQREPRANLRTAALLLTQAVPAAIVLFLLFPRVQGPIWGLPQDDYAGMTGLSETMTPGSVAHLAQFDAWFGGGRSWEARPGRASQEVVAVRRRVSRAGSWRRWRRS